MTQTNAVADTVHSWGDLMSPTDPTEFWTLAIFLVSAIGAGVTVWLAVVAHRGLGSLGLTKKDFKTRVERDSAQCALDRCSEMALELLPMHAELLGDYAAAGVPEFVSDANQVTFKKGEEGGKVEAAERWVRRLSFPTQQATILLMNRLEAWAMFFQHGLADEKIARTPCSSVFSSMVVSLYPCFLAQRGTNSSGGPYQNVVELFEGWYSEKRKGEIMDNFRSVQEGAKKLRRPIGEGP